LTPASVFRERTDGTFSKAKQLVPQCLDMVTVDQIRRFFRHCCISVLPIELRKVVQGCARLCKVAQGCARLHNLAQVIDK
jgi:hypothetical protein